MINYTFFMNPWPYHGEFIYAKIFAKFLKTKFLFKEN